MSIITHDITKVYGSQVVLDNVNINIGQGEIVGLLGPNGAGKSTLMKILTGYIPPTSGTASVYGHDVLFDTEEVKKIVGYLPEHNPLYLDMYIKEYLEFVAGIHKLGKESKSRIREIIEKTGLGPEQNKKIGTLSKGYRQRVGLAQALIHNPEVLILDEPTSGLDPNQLLEIRELIKGIGKEKTVILSTHIMQEVEAICSRAIIINLGKIVADGSTTELSNIQKHDIVTVEFETQTSEKHLLTITGVVKVVKINDLLWKLEAKPGEDIRPRINKFAVENNMTLLSLHREEHNLEQVFQELTGKGPGK
ncbi:MAG: gliding motility-associated ABC transporter ATP-binding subunit GldA [Bacteroidales bacterium]|nr:gliding motility-associated ABC transporter ATP-binding subunit GldA [Bacteroidales bacterium]